MVWPLPRSVPCSGLKCRIYMGQIDARRQALNVARMRMLGAEVVEVTLGDQASSRTPSTRRCATGSPTSKTPHYLLGTVAGPHPFPSMVRDFQKIIGEEAKQQLQDWYGIDHPQCDLRLRRRRLQRHRRHERLPRRRAREPLRLRGRRQRPRIRSSHAIRFAPGTGQLGMFQGSQELPAGKPTKARRSTPTRSPQASITLPWAPSTRGSRTSAA